MRNNKIVKQFGLLGLILNLWVQPTLLNVAYAADAAQATVNAPTKDMQNQAAASKSQDAGVAKPAEKNPTFNVFEFKVNGNSVLTTGKIEEAVYPFLGPDKTIADVENARLALEKTYQDAGYLTVSVQIPQQEVDGGVVQLTVSEGTVDKLRIKDSQYSSLSEIKTRVAEFNEGKVPHFPTAQKQLSTVNRGANRQVTPVLRAGTSPGKVEVDLKVQDKLPLHGNIELNNRYPSSTTKTRLNGGLRYENLWQKDHSLGISFQVTPEDTDETKVISATYLIPRLNGDYFAAYGVISKSDISVVGDINVVGNGVIFGARYIKPLPLLDNFYHNLTFGIDYKDFDENVNLLGSDGFQSPIAYTSFLMGYDGAYRGNNFQTQFNLGANFSTLGFGNDEKDFRRKRSFAEPNYSYLRADIKHLQKLPFDWSLQAKLGGQATNDPLVSAEQFTIGGAESVRGYLESQALGDYGVFASLELRTPPLLKYIPNKTISDEIKDLYAFSFIDAGQVNTLKPLPDQEESADLLSVGVGLRLKLTKGYFTNLDYSHVLSEAGDIEKGDERLLFRVGYEW